MIPVMWTVFQSQDTVRYEAPLEHTLLWCTLSLWGRRVWFLMPQCLWASQALPQGMWTHLCGFI